MWLLAVAVRAEATVLLAATIMAEQVAVAADCAIAITLRLSPETPIR